MGQQDIMDWSGDSPQWPDILASIDSPGAYAKAATNPLWPIYGPLFDPRSQKEPFVIGQIGQSLDGRVATESGHSHYINGKTAIIHLHRLRALVDAVIVGVATAISDDPQLTVRHGVNGPQPARVIIDPNGRLDSTARCLGQDGARRIVVHAGCHAVPEGVERVRIPMAGGYIEPKAILSELYELGLRRILIEGGATTLSRFLDVGCVNRLHVMVAPMILGSGRAGLQLPAIESLDDALRPAVSTFKFPDGDILFDCGL